MKFCVRFSFTSAPTFSLMLGALLACTPLASARAQNDDKKPIVDEVDIEAMRRELARIRQSTQNQASATSAPQSAKPAAPVLAADSLTESQPSAQSVREKMLAKEAELLNLLTSSKGELPAAIDASAQGAVVTTSGATSPAAAPESVVAPTTKVPDAAEAVRVHAAQRIKEQPTSVTQEAKGPEVMKPESLQPLSVKASEEPAMMAEASSDRARLANPAKSAEKASNPGESTHIRSLENALVSLRKENSTLEQQLAKGKIKQSELANELDEVRNRLMVAERQVELMSARLANRNIETRRNALGVAAPIAAAPATAPAPQVQRRIPLAQPVDARPAADMTVARVVAEKANLRSAPGLNNSPMMTVPRGTTLVVETSQGDWFRVYAPNGTRAWVSGDVLEFVPSGQSAGASAGARVKAYDAGY